MPEPIGVAFVEVRPEVDDFRTTAERDIQQSIGPVDVQGQVRLQGLQEAKADVSALTGDLKGISGTQLQFPGLEDARLNAVGLSDAMQEATGVSVRGTFQPLLDDVGRLRGEAEALSASLSGLPTSVALDQGDIDATVDSTAALADAQAGLGDTLGTSATAASALLAKYPQLVSGEQAAAAATAQSAVAAREAAVAEDRLADIRLKSRRSQAVGPLRVAGIGLGVGTALFAATRAVGDLSEAMRVGGEDASTFQGKMRNLGASLLSGDVVGAIKALTNNTRDYSTAQLQVISQSPKMLAAFKELQGADIGRAQQAAVGQLTQVPQFLQTRISGAQLEGNEGAELAALQKAEQVLTERTKTLRQIGLDQTTLNVALEEVFRQRKTIRDRIEAVTKEERPDILAPLVERVTDARLAGASAAIVKALRAEAAALLRVINAAKTSAEDRGKFKDQLFGVNRDIEATQEQVKAEAERHQQAMLDARLAPTEEAIIDAQLGGGSTTAALQARANTIQAILDRGTIDGKKLTRDQRVGLKNELVSINGQIESAQDEITAENQRHADAIAAKVAEADQAALRSISVAERGPRNRQLVAQATEGLVDDIRVSNELQRVYKRSIAVARKRIADAKLRADTVAGLTSQLLQEEQNEAGLRRRRRTERVTLREESLDLDIQIAQANENERAEVRAHRAKIAFLRGRIRHTREGTNERKRLRAEIAQEQAAIRGILDADKESESAGTTLADLFSKQVEIGRRAGFDAGLAPKVGDLTQPIEDQVANRLQARADVTIKSPLQRNDDRIVRSQEKLTAAIEKLTATIPNASGAAAGATASTVFERNDDRLVRAATRLSQSRRAKQLLDETASA